MKGIATMPKVSIIMPSYNKEAYIAKAIESVINQTYKDWELIVIDDMSTDNSVEIIKSFTDDRIVFFENETNIGMAANRNRALEMAKGEYIALLDADDITTDIRIGTEVAYLDEHLDVDVVFGDCQEIDENDNETGFYFTLIKNPAFIKAKLRIQDPVPNGSCMYRKAFVDKYKIRYRDDLLGMDDYMFWVECSLHGKIVGLPHLFLYWRNTASNGTNTFKYSEEYCVERKRKYGEIQAFALNGNGFSLTEKEIKIYNTIFSEDGYQIEERGELEDSFKLVKKICHQAEQMDNAKVIQLMFKRQFGIVLERSFVWS